MYACELIHAGLCDELQARNREAGLGRWGGGEPATGIRLVRQEPSILIGVVCDLTCLDFRQNTHKIGGVLLTVGEIK